MTVSSPLLEVHGLTKIYGGAPALANVSFTLGPGEVLGLLGENGAGKSTLVKILAGIEQADLGTFVLGGASTGSESGTGGVAFIHQDLGLVETLTVAENFALTNGFPTRFGVIQWDRVKQRARMSLQRFDIELDPDRLVAELSLAEQACVAIARALDDDVRILILDEPTAGLSAHEARKLFEIVERLKSSGAACILITHRTDEVLTVCDRVAVLRNGELVALRGMAGLVGAELVTLILGTEISAARTADERTQDPNPDTDAIGLSLTNFRAAVVGPIDLTVVRGEVLGVTGLADSGHINLLEALYGLTGPCTGEVQVGGTAYRPCSAHHALARSISFVHADRNAASLAGNLSVRENLHLNPTGGAVSRLDLARERTETSQTLEDFDVRPRNPEAAVSTLSGGNAQKIAVARALAQSPQVLLLCEPTAGVDAGARRDIHAKARAVAAAGGVVLVASSDYEELGELCHRVLVLHRGRASRTLAGTDITTSTILEASYGF